MENVVVELSTLLREMRQVIYTRPVRTTMFMMSSFFGRHVVLRIIAVSNKKALLFYPHRNESRKMIVVDSYFAFEF